MTMRPFLRFAGLVMVYLVVAVPFKAMNLIPGFTDVRPVMALGPVYAVFFGPVGCLASGFGNLIADAVDHAIRWTSIAGFASNFLGPLLVWWFWTRFSRTSFSLRTPRDLLRHCLVLVVMAVLETAIVVPAVALVYPEVDIGFLTKAVFGNTAGFPIVFGIPLAILMQEEFGFKAMRANSKHFAQNGVVSSARTGDNRPDAAHCAQRHHKPKETST